MENRICANAD